LTIEGGWHFGFPLIVWSWGLVGWVFGLVRGEC